MIVVQRSKPWMQQAFTPIAHVDGTNGLPILTTDYRNRSFTGGGILPWTTTACSGKEWLINDPPRYEWTPAYNPDGQYDDDAAGLSGFAFAPVDGSLSNNDVWFTHPFGFDWETLIASDARFYELMAPSNSGIDSSNSEYVNGMNRARELLLNVPQGIINTETDQDLIPPPYRDPPAPAFRAG